MDSAPVAPRRLLSLRMASGLACILAVEAFVACWVVAGPSTWLPYSGMVPVVALPQAICVAAVFAGALAAPLLISRAQNVNAREMLPEIYFAATWQGLVAGLFLMVTSRIVPLEPAAIAAAGCTIGCFALACLLIAHAMPRGFAGVLFVWLVALPICGYFLAEVFMMATGKIVIPQAVGTPTLPIHSCLHWILCLSPATASMGAISGTLVDESVFSLTPFAALALGISLALTVKLLWRQRLKKQVA